MTDPTKVSVDTLEAGRALDALVAEHVLGLCDHDLRDNRDEARAETIKQARREWEEEYGSPPPEAWRPEEDFWVQAYLKCAKCGKTWAVGSNELGPSREYWLKRYSTDIAAAWDIVMKYASAGCAGWMEFDGHTGAHAGVTSGNGRFEGHGDTAPLAICRAALKAVGYGE